MCVCAAWLCIPTVPFLASCSKGQGAAPKFSYGAGCLGSASQQAALLLSNIYIDPIKHQTEAHIYFSEVMSCHPLPPLLCGDQGLAPVFRLKSIVDAPLLHFLPRLPSTWCRLSCNFREIVFENVFLMAWMELLSDSVSSVQHTIQHVVTHL